MKSYLKQFILHKAVYLLILVCGFLLFEISRTCLYMQEEDSYYTINILYPIVNYSIYYFIILLLTSVQYFHSSCKYHMQEALDGISYKKSEKGQIFCIFILHVIFTIFVMGYYLFLYLCCFKAVPSLLIHIMLNIIVNIGICGVLAIVTGKNLSLLSSDFFRIIVLTAIICIISPIKNEINYWIGLDTSFIEIFPENSNFIVNGYVGYPIQLQRIAIILFWIFLNLIIIEFYLNKNIKKIMYSAAAGLVAIVCLCTFLIPHTNLTGLGKKSSMLYSQIHYLGLPASEKKESGFRIKGYDMELDISNQLKASVTIDIEKDKEEKEYIFTLYHDFLINGIYDQYGNNLVYKKNGDYLFIDAVNDIESITFEYKGKGRPFYAEFTGIYLPPGVPYYPVAGFHKVYDEKNRCFCKIELPEAVPFSVQVNSQQKVYSNLSGNDSGSFTGCVKEVVFLGGFVNEICYGGYRFLFPSTYSEEVVLKDIKKTVEKFQDFKGGLKESLSDKVFVWLPGINAADREAYFDDLVMCYMFKEEYLVNWYKEQYMQSLNNLKIRN